MHTVDEQISSLQTNDSKYIIAELYNVGDPPSPLLAVPTTHHINGQCTNFILFDVAL